MLCLFHYMKEGMSISLVILIFVIGLVNADTNIRIESVIRDRIQKNRTIIDEHQIVFIKGSSSENHFLQGELMPFEPIDGCGNLEASNFTKFDPKTGTYSFNRWSSPDTPIITMMTYDSQCTINNRYSMLSDMSFIQAVILIYSGDTLPTSSIDIELSKESNLSVLLVPKTLGMSILDLCYWYRSNPIHMFDDSETRNLLSESDTIVESSAELPAWNHSTKKFTFPNSNNLIEFSNNNQQNLEYGWLQTTIYLNSGSPGPNFGLVEFSLVLVVVLLTVAFITSVVLHCYFYHARTRRERDRFNGRDSSGNVATRELLTREQLKHLSQDQYGTLRSSSTPNANVSDNTSSSPPLGTAITICNGQSKELYQSNASIYTAMTSNDTCPICLDEYESADMLRILPCSHIYHPQCIDEWLLVKSASCPMCKYNVSEYIKGIESAMNASRKQKNLKKGSANSNTNFISRTETSQLDQDIRYQQQNMSRWKRYWLKFRDSLSSRRSNTNTSVNNPTLQEQA